MKRCVVLLSGGIDSSTTLAIARSEGYEVFALSFCYGQRHEVELKSAKDIATSFGITNHTMLDIDLGQIGGSALTSDINVPKDRKVSDMGSEIPITYVPARNTIFLSFALALAEVVGADAIFIGANALDYSGYPDCRPEYLSAFEAMANLATKAGVSGKSRFKIIAPLINLTKGEIIKKGLELGVDFSLTHSCYDPDPEGSACMRCDSCILRKKGFDEAGIPDPAAEAVKRGVGGRA
ncbi:MAG TPA: 7-cyano-7-deazaguanine synthase QueC [Nitrospiria bacterium]|nr:7-cyano-7-deazaguanine synthase QueC [Nitrospiria bacterium]